MNAFQHSEGRVHIATRVASCIGVLVLAAWLAALFFVLGKGKLGSEGAIVFLASLPIVAWIGNFSVRVLSSGLLPANSFWPFASYRVLLVYFALAPLALHAAFG